VAVDGVFDPDDSPDDDDPELDAEVERALAPFKHLVPLDVVETMRETLADLLLTHPIGERLMKQARQAAKHDPSGTRLKGSQP
jgi:hypothetical protein